MSRHSAAQLDQLSSVFGESIQGVLFDLDGTLISKRKARLLTSLSLLHLLPLLQRIPGARRVATLKPGIAQTLDDLRRTGLRIGILTNGLASKRRVIEALDLSQWADGIVISSEENTRKPDATLFHRAAQDIGLPSSQILFVGDSRRADMQGAHDCGMHTLWLTSAQRRRKPNPPSVDAEAASVRDLTHLLRRGR